MIIEFFKDTIYTPLFNTLIALLHVVPGADLGFAIIVLTIGIKTLLYPVQRNISDKQEVMKKIQPEFKALKGKGLTREEEARAMLDLYKKYKTSPFAIFKPILIQVIVLMCLYFVFLKGFTFPPEILAQIDHASGQISGSLMSQESKDALYSFVSIPETIRIKFLGFFDLTEASLLLAILAGLTQYIQGRIMLSRNKVAPKDGKRSLEEEIEQNTQTALIYVFPFMIAGIAWKLFNGAIALYWVTGNIFGAITEFVRHRNLAKKEAEGTTQ